MIESNPKNIFGWEGKGNLLKMLKRYDKAI